MFVSFLLGVAVGFILGLVFAAITAGSFGRRRPTPSERTWPLPPNRSDSHDQEPPTC